ncbi:SOS response-associated peptidase [Ramlibacter terrae]|uniref:Abasic site processing protein n=1 Tax=Ramlibacter terrae TaxID=2732511 RepID=A0ABX6P598_9BURK|nr:SOS response-associated peptidase [Ramlibacter terrae]
MCNRYRAVSVTVIRDVFGFTLIEEAQPLYATTGIGPLQQGPFIHAGGAVVGQWGLIPWFSKTRRPTGTGGRPISTNNCRIETAATAPSFKTPWARGQRCLIPAIDYDEPNWESGRNVWWRFARRDGQPWALAGLWTEWTDPATGELVPSYTMLTQNCDAHPVLNRMHKPDPSLPPDAQDKRAVIPVEREHWAQWLQGDAAQAPGLVRLPDASLIAHGPAEAAPAQPSLL